MADVKVLDKYSPKGRKVHPVKWPGTGRTVGILMLRCDETLKCEVEAREELAKRGLGLEALINRDLLVREEEIQQVYRMVVDPESKGQKEHRVFKSSDEVRTRLEPWERSYFVTWLLHHMEESKVKMDWPPDAME